MDREGLVQLRHRIHQHPELSGAEKETARTIKEFLKPTGPDEIVEGLGDHGIAFIYNGKEDGPTILLRCELDALPIQEDGGTGHDSAYDGISHKCGHDGHMAIISGVGRILENERPEKGRVVLLYQPAEETGEGAEQVINSPEFSRIEPDHVFALHNLPGHEKGKIVTKPGIFASASKGMEIFLYGRTAHAGEPQNGKSPAIAMADIVKQLYYLPQADSFQDFVLTTVIHARLGEIAFGTSPGYAEVRATLRSYLDDDMDFLTEKAEELAVNESRKEGLAVGFDYKEVFPSSLNDKGMTQEVVQAASDAGLAHGAIQEPFKWSEDFGHFLHKYPGVLFGLGSGKGTPDLHNSDYDFPDDIIEPGISIFHSIIKRLLG